MAERERETIGVGIIGMGSERGWARAAHVPALRALDAYDIRAVCASRRASAERSACELGVPLAFDDHRQLLARPEVELAVVTVNVTHHAEIVRAAVDAGKAVLCEWPLGRNLEEAHALTEYAAARGARTAIGLQGRFAPAVQYLRHLVADGYVGTVLGTHVAGAAPDAVWAAELEPAYEFHADARNGATLLSIVAGHAVDAICAVLGDFVDVSATMATRRPRARRLRDGANVPWNAPDEVAFGGTLAGGALASVHYHGGPAIGADFTWTIHGSEGHLEATAPRGYANIAPLTLRGRRGDGAVETLVVPERYHAAPPALASAAVNVAGLYRQLALDITAGTHGAPDFAWALRRHRLIDAIERAARTGVRQSVS